jgi:hypothetical protein
MSWGSIIQSIVLSIIAAAAVFAILWMLRRRRYLPTLRPIVTPFVQGPRLMSAGLRNFAHRANRTMRFHTAESKRVDTRPTNYEIWSNKLPMTRKVLEQVRSLAKSNEPFFGVLVSTHPPTIGMTGNGPIPLVARLIAVKDLDPSSLGDISGGDLVATFHTHRSRLDVLEHDENAFRVIDAFAGPKIHIIGSVNGLQFYHTRHSPVVIKRDNSPEVR